MDDRTIAAARAVAERAARAGGAVLAATDRTTIDVGLKDARADMTTSADRAAQQAAVDVLLAAHPDHAVVGEEGPAGRPATTDVGEVWYVDGLDGTSNFAHGLPWYCVSVALRSGPEVVAAAVYDPVHDELFSAGHGAGATRERGGGGRRRSRQGREVTVPLRVDPVAEIARAVVVTQVQTADPAVIAEHVRVVEGLLNACAGVRSPGAPALIMSHIAAGHYTGYVERAMPPWDISAGQLILEEAGGRVTDLAGRRVASAAPTDVVATNGAVHDDVLVAVRSALDVGVTRRT